MSFFESWVYPNNPPTTCETLFHCDRKLVIVGVIGRSAFPDCNKMSGLIVLDSHPSHLNQECYEGQIRFYYSKLEDVLFLHFQTTYDEYCMRKVLAKKMGNSQSGQHLNFNQYVRNRFAKMLLFATQVCHIVVFVELSIAFDSSMISILKSLKVIRETHVLKFLPKLLKNSSASACLGKGSRICSPRCLFFFENYPDGYDKTEDSISRLEFEIEDNIYKMFRNEFIIPNKSTSLALPALEDSDITAFWSLESIGIRSEDAENQHLAEELIASCIKRKGTRYIATLPWKDSQVSAGNNRNQAIKRLLYLSTHLSRIPDRFEEYDKAIRQMVIDGIAEPVSANSCGTPKRVFYLPHRPVYKDESTTTKMRIVFDASARSDDTPSLNDMRHVGANLLPDVLKILLNFRFGRIGIVADVEKAFLQILLSEEDRDSHRFIWLSPQKSSDGMPKFEELRMTRVTFGVNCSPFLLTATLRHHFAEEKPHFQSTCDVLKDGFYMDDLVVSIDNEDEGLTICQEASQIMSNANMNLRKWNSNNSLIRERFGSVDVPPVQKVLGIAWFVFSDEIAVPFTAVESLLMSNLAKATKRNVLQTIARIYDPLGMLAPTVIKVKILFQEVWKRKVSWDEVIPAELLLEWDQCVKNLSELKDVTIPRPVAALSSTCKVHILHIFADASMKAYGTVAYLKNINFQNECSVGFLCAKNRVAPLKEDGTKELTLPKLELTAALIASRLCCYLKKSLTIPIERVYMWTDSKIALYWIQGEQDRWKPYVQSRVSEIRRHTNTTEWNHCSGKENPADLLTRGVAAEHLRSSSLWAQGPAWLKDDNYRTDDIYQPPTTAVPLFLLETVSGCTKHEPVLCFEDFSTWNHLLRVTCLIFRIARYRKNAMRKPSLHLTAGELVAAESYWISGTPLFSLPGNKRFVYFNTDEKIREDPLLKTLTELQLSFENNNYLKDDTISNMEEQRVFGNFGIPLVQNADAQIEVTPKRNNFMQFLKDHVKEALQFGFDDGVSKFKTISLVPNVRMWYETFKLFHNIFIENPDNPDYEPADPAYKSFLENFDKLMDIDEGFFFKCCENGVKKACNVYSNPILSHYGNTFQKALIDDALSVFSAHARGPNVDKSGQKLIQNFEQCLIKESQCESLGIRARNSVVAKQNSSKQILISSSNCRRIQCSREDLYVMRQQNYEFYQILPDVCVFCVKNKKYELLN